MLDDMFGNLNETRNSFASGSFGDYRDGERKYLLLLGDYYVAGTDHITDSFASIVNMLEHKHTSTAKVFLAAAAFHTAFAHLAPMANYNGRIVKLLTNLYLTTNGLDMVRFSSP